MIEQVGGFLGNSHRLGEHIQLQGRMWRLVDHEKIVVKDADERVVRGVADGLRSPGWP